MVDQEFPIFYTRKLLTFAIKVCEESIATRCQIPFEQELVLNLHQCNYANSNCICFEYC